MLDHPYQENGENNGDRLYPNTEDEGLIDTAVKTAEEFFYLTKSPLLYARPPIPKKTERSRSV